jgi:hypothetical protein
MKMSKYLQQGKSENYQDAEDKQLLKAGEVAALLTKKFKVKITALELSPFATEWHHGGIFKSTTGQSLKGKRVFFFKPTDIEKVSLEQILRNREKAAAPKPPPDNSIVQGWYVQFFKMTDPVSRRLISKAFVGIYKGPKLKVPKGFKALGDEAFAVAEKQRGRELKKGEVCEF